MERNGTQVQTSIFEPVKESVGKRFSVFAVVDLFLSNFNTEPRSFMLSPAARVEEIYMLNLIRASCSSELQGLR